MCENTWDWERQSTYGEYSFLWYFGLYKVPSYKLAH